MFRLLPQETLYTPRLTLRPFRMEDAEANFRNWDSNPKVAEFMLWDPSKTVADSRERIEEFLRDYTPEKGFFVYAITQTGSDEPIGCVMLGWIDSDHHSGELVYMLSPAAQGKGYMTEAVSALLDFAFGKLLNPAEYYKKGYVESQKRVFIEELDEIPSSATTPW